MAPVDPGTTVHWARNPAYTTSLISAISGLTRVESDSLFASSKSHSNQWKQSKQATLNKVTRQVFTANGDEAREKKQRDSIGRRLNQLAKEYQDSLGTLKQDPFNVPETLDELRETCPYWDQLRALLKDHPEMTKWDENEDRAREDEDETGAQNEEEATDEAQAMQDVHYHHHQPIAGPSNQNRHLESPPNRNRVQNPPPLNPWTAQLLRERQKDNLALTNSSPRPRSPVDERSREMRERAEAAAMRRLGFTSSEADALPDDPWDDSHGMRGGAGARGADARPERRRSASPPIRRPGLPRAGGGRVPSPVADQQRDQDAYPQDEDQENDDEEDDFARREQPDDDALTSCPKCSLYLLDFSPDESEAHMRQCLDGSNGAHLETCPVCERSLNEPGWDRARAEQHVDDCCKALTGGGPGAGGERKGVKDHVVFACDEKSVPRDDKTGEALECSFCLDEFEPGTSLARLSCYCIYHEPCIKAYWAEPGKFCPLHRDLDGPSEVEMR